MSDFDKILHDVLKFFLCALGWIDFQECVQANYFLKDWMLRSFKCIEISQTEQTLGLQTLSQDGQWPIRAKHRSS